MRQASSAITDIIVVGGNHSGLSLAAVLGSAGFRVLCLERAARPQRHKPLFDGRTVALSFRSAQLLKTAGVWQHIEVVSCPILDIRVADQASPLYLDFDHRDIGDNPFGWIVENTLFKAALEKRLKQMPNITMVYDASVEGLTLDANQANVVLKDGRTFSASLVVAADGRGSRCRELAGIETYGWSYRQTALVCTIAHEFPHNNVAVEHFHPSGPFATLPMTQQRSSIVWTEQPETADVLMKMNDEDFTKVLETKVKAYLGHIKLLGKRATYPLSLQHAIHYTAPRMALVGDAAHGIHPIAGQGLNLGMADIEILTEELINARHLGLDLGSPYLLRRYEKRRQFDNGNMVLMTDLLDRLFSNASPPVQSMRRLGLGLVQNMPGLRKFFMRTAMGIRKSTASVPKKSA